MSDATSESRPIASSEAANATRAKLNALTGLRFVAAAMIVVHHSRMLEMPVPPWAWDHGVSFFFVLSGFIIAYAYPALDNRREVCNFLGARIARIWPAHFVALCLAIVLLGTHLNGYFVPNLLLIHGWVPSWSWYFSYNGPSWSISVEMFFYLAFPVLIFRWSTSWWWKWIASAAVVVALICLGAALQLPDISPKGDASLHGLLYINPLARLFEFTTGMVTYSAYCGLQAASHKFPDFAFTLLEVLVLALAGYSIARFASSYLLAEFVTIYPLVAWQWLGHNADVVTFPFVVLVFAFGRGWLSRFLGSRPMVLMGEISFSIYLIHTTIFGYYTSHWQIARTGPDYPGFVICIAAMLALAFLIWAVVEVPCRTAAKRWLSRKLLFMPLPGVSGRHA